MTLPRHLIAILDELCGAIGPVRALAQLEEALPRYHGHPGVASLVEAIDGKTPVQAMTAGRALLGITEPA